MIQYHSPLQFMRFLLHEVFTTEESLNKMSAYSDFNRELMDAILEEAANFSEQVLLPLNHSGDQQGCVFNEGRVTTPEGFKEAYQKFSDGGWTALGCAEEYGGQPIPKSLHLLIEEIFYACNTSFGLYPNLTNTAILLIATHASDELKNVYLENMISGQWSGTMCLTESHAGSDLGLIRTKAVKNQKGSYNITGTKIFISAGEHDLTSNIIHLVLAKLPDSPAGSKGISLFLVPKYIPKADSEQGQLNNVICSGIEHKMGLKASATCVLNFDEAEGYLIGDINQGLKCMFTMMNNERLSVGIQGLGIAEVAKQSAISYALERKQGRTKSSESEAVEIIQHPDIKRSLLSIMSMNGGSRALVALTGSLYDQIEHHPEKSERVKASQCLSILTPVCKAFITDQAFINCNLAIQVYGGHGYIVESGIEQLVRDVRITQLYEGTNGIQSIDLLSRKILSDNGHAWSSIKSLLKQMIRNAEDINNLGKDISKVKAALTNLCSITDSLLEDCPRKQGLAGAVATEYMSLFGTVILGCLWLKMATTAINSGEETPFNQHIKTLCSFYCQHHLSTVATSVERIMSGYKSIHSASTEEFEIALG